MCSAVPSAAVLLLLLVHVQDAAGALTSEIRANCLRNYPPRPCRGGWIRMTNTKCVKHFGLRRTFWQAESHCVSLGGHLVSMHNPDEFSHTLCLTVKTPKRAPTTNDHFWIGAKGAHPTSGYGWTDGSPFSFTRWYQGQPDNRARHVCVEMNYRDWGQWNNEDCSKNRNYVCVINM